MVNLTPQQLDSIKHGQPLRFVDPESGDEFVVIRADVFDRVKLMIDDSDLDSAETLPLVWQTMKEDWEDPSMDVYDHDPETP